VEGNASYDVKTSLGDFGVVLATTYYLKNDYQTAPSTPATTLLNLLGLPPRLRARGGFSWADRQLSSSLFVNYTGSYDNPLFTPYEHISSLTTVDWQVTYRLADHLGFSGRSGLRISLNIQNIFDRNPPHVAYPGGGRDLGFDAVNASPFGRVVSLQLVKSW